MTPGRALVTGAGRRLGRAMGLDLARSGWSVAFHYMGSSEGAETAAAEARAANVDAVAIQADLMTEDGMASLVSRSADALGGPLSLLINSASIFENDVVETMTRESWDRGIESNLRAPVRLTQAFAEQAPPALRDANDEPVASAVVINMLDMRVLKPTPFFFSYAIAKNGLHTFTRMAAQHLAPGIRIAAIGPGPTLQGDRQTDAHYAMQRSNCVLGRGSDPEDIVSAMRFIIENKAFTGQMLAIDGGQHLAWKTPDVLGWDE